MEMAIGRLNRLHEKGLPSASLKRARKNSRKITRHGSGAVAPILLSDQRVLFPRRSINYAGITKIWGSINLNSGES